MGRGWGLARKMRGMRGEVNTVTCCHPYTWRPSVLAALSTRKSDPHPVLDVKKNDGMIIASILYSERHSLP